METIIESLYINHYEALYKAAYAILKNHTDAEDVVAEGFLIFLEKGQTIDPLKAHHWMHVVITNKAKAYYHANHRSVPFDCKEERCIEESSLLFAKKQANVESLVVQQDLLIHINTFLSCHLNEIQLKCIKGYYFEDLTYQEISDKYQLNIGTVRSNLSRGRSRLKVCLEQETKQGIK